MPPPSVDTPAQTVRLLADPRRGIDRRVRRRREVLQLMSPERRARPDRRLGPERRSTLDRRVRSRPPQSVESPGEHVRNAQQLLTHLDATADLSADDRADLAAVGERLRRALRLLDGRRNHT